MNTKTPFDPNEPDDAELLLEKIQKLINRVRDGWSHRFARPWSLFKTGVERCFALSDHSAIRGSRVMVRIILALLFVSILWASLFDIDQVIHAQGQVIASSRTQIVQAADGGVLAEMRVEEGDEVQMGQVIAILEKDRAMAAYTESFGKVVALRMTVARLRAELADKPLVYSTELSQRYADLVQAQMNLYQQRRAGYLEMQRVLADTLRLAEQELALNTPLLKYGDVSQADILRLRKAVNEARSSQVNHKTKYFQDASTELNKAEEDLNTQEQNLADRTELLIHTDIHAPAAGIVKNVKVTTLGAVVRQGDELLQILPTESDLVIEAKVKPVDMASLRVGLPAKVKLDAYDYSIFGAMKGIVTYVSPDTLTEETKMGQASYYRVKVNIGEAELRDKASDIEVRPGMTATVDIRTGTRSVMSFILKPITKTLSESFGER